jgi:hypothetical protein
MMEAMLPSRDMPLFLFQQEFQMKRMGWLTLCHAAQAMCLAALRA